MAKITKNNGKTGVSYKIATTSGKLRFSYVNLFEPSSFGESQPNYSVQLLIPKTDTDTIKAINEAIADIASSCSIKLNPTRPILRDGDVEKAGDATYKGMYFIQPKKYEKQGKPYVVNEALEPITTSEPVISLDGKADYSNAFYSGCYGNASINIAKWEYKGQKGISTYLNGVQKCSDGEPLGGKQSNPFDDFK